MNRSLLKATLPIAAFVYLSNTVHAQLTVQNNLTPNDLVNNILVGQGVTVSNVMFNGQPANTVNDQAGSFNGTNSNIGLASGLVLATGKVILVEGPNNYPSLTVPPANPWNTPDPDLGYFVSSQHSVAVLEFDFIPTGDSLSFRFVFGSEEYPEYVCSQYNDVFGFFLSGRGINGPYTNSAVNLALVPGSTAPVAINTVNPGVPGFGNASTCASSDPNWQANSIYYVDNTSGATVELDGFTVPIRAKAVVQCGQSYHIKIAIAHAGDATLDSAVLIEGGSFTSTGSLTVSVSTPLGDGTLTEGCGEALVTITRPSSGDQADIQLTYTGMSITPGDLNAPPAQVSIPTGEDHVTFPISTVRDLDAEGSESLTLIASWTSNCGFTIVDSVSLALLDYTPMEIFAEDVWLRCDRDSVLLEATVNGGLGQINLAWGSAEVPGPCYAPGLEDGSYTVTSTDQCPETVRMQIHVHAGCDIVIPNVISPNGDGHNDTWVINGLAKSGSSVKVFNRWGNMVYETANYGNNWKGIGLPDGTYFYEVIDGRTGKRLTGHLTILANGKR
ncbi:MAG: choice-of-anchor L domain-containing protein [Flavobacteriales bacterium]|nr:choice-of-anchor L domain-containing protein [Flavobacteriales bacterium]